MRVYKLKAFARFQRREGIADAGLAKAVRSAEEGLVDAELGGGLICPRRTGKERRVSHGNCLQARRTVGFSVRLCQK